MDSKFMFTGRYQLKTDSDGRLTLPAPWRQELSKSERADEVAVFPSRYSERLKTEVNGLILSHEDFAEVLNDITKIEDSAERDAAIRFYSANAERLTLDGRGRIRLPGWLLQDLSADGRPAELLGDGRLIWIKSAPADEQPQ